MKTGWARIYRQIEDNPLWLSEKFTRGQAWIDLIIFANHKPGSFYIRGNKVEIGRGQIGWSEVTMAKRWKWSRNKVRGYLASLQSQKMIQQKKNFTTSIITIIEYDKYQSEGQQTEQQTEQQKDSRLNTNKNDKNYKNDKNITNKLVMTKVAPQKNIYIECLLKEFELLFGFPPTDKKSRFVAQAFRKNIEAFLRVFDSNITYERFENVVKTYFKWISSQDYAENIQRLETIKLKFPIWSTPKVTDYRKGNHANNEPKE